MEAEKILTANLDDLIFENRNKEYGAYLLRKLYDKYVSVAHIISMSLFLLLIIAHLVAAYIKPRIEAKKKLKAVDINMLDIPSIDKTVTPPPTVEAPPPIKSTVKFVPPVIKKDEEVQEEDMPPTVEELKDVDPGTKTQEGNPEGVYDFGDVEGTGDVEAVIEDKPIVEEPLLIAEQMPEFPGGIDAMYEYIRTHYVYPWFARQAGIQGTIRVIYVVEKDGSITDVKILKGIGNKECEDEAIRVVRSMPKWKPGKQNGASARVRYIIPIVLSVKGH